DEFHHIEPRTTRDDIGAVVWEAESGHADPSLTTTSFANAARNAGVETRTGVEVHRLIAPRGRIEALETGDTRYSAGRVVVAANYRTKDLLKTIGIDLPLKPIRHTIAIVERSADFGPFPPIVADRILGAYYRPDGDTRSLIGNVNFERGTVDDDVETAKPGDRREIESLVGRFAQRWRGQDSATLARSYSGVYDCTPDLQPVLGPVGGVEGLFVAAGFSGHGFKLSPAVGEMLSSAVVGERSKIANVGLFDLHRFAREQPIRDQFTYAPAPSGLVPSGTSVKLPPQEGGS
ncbi:MAG: FAD-binding oxidoreductase, partial [Chloroflexi bacterium]|nr:FAD-binding oxidoreductase [Chloroflexota bacterium]